MINLITKMTCISLGLASMSMAQDIVITQNPDCATDAASMVACGGAGTTAENWFARNILIDQDVTINSITWGSAAVNSTSATIYFSIASGPGNPDGVTLTPVGQATAAINAGPFYDTPVDTPFEVPAGSYLVVEFQFPDTGTEPGVWPANTTTATETCYIMAADCGLTAYSDVAAIGFPDAQMIMCLNATVGSFDPCTLPLPLPCPTDINGDGNTDVSDVLAVIGSWGTCGDGTFRPAGDVAPLPNGDCCVDVGDVLAVVGGFGADCSVYGGCCLGDGSCSEETSADCAAAGGVYYGDNTTCADGSCDAAACCLADMSCSMLTGDACSAAGGTAHVGYDCLTWDCSVATPGDECADALVAMDGANPFDTTNMTPSSPEPDDTNCTGPFTIEWMNSQDVWFVWTAGATDNYIIDTCDLGSFDTTIIVYQDSCDNQIACNGDLDANDVNCQVYSSEVILAATAGTTYYFRIGGWQASAGPGTLNINIVPPPLPGACCLPGNCLDNLDSDQCAAFGGTFAGEGTLCADGVCDLPMGACCRLDDTCYEIDEVSCTGAGNTYYGDSSACADTDCAASMPGDECADAVAATLGANAYDTTNMTPSSPEPDETMCAGTYMDWLGSPDVWMSFVAGSSASHTFTTCDAASYDTSMALYEGDCNTQVACNGDGSGSSGCQSYYSQFDYNCTAGTTYYVRIGGWQAAVGAGTLTITADDPNEMAACCDMGSCLGDMLEVDCATAGGNWVQGESCATYSCPQPACPGAQISQNVHTVDDGWSAGTSTNDPTNAAVYNRAELVNLASMSDLSVWGLQLFYSGAWGACTTDYGFNVRAYDDAGGLPGALSAEALNVAAVKTATGDLYAGLYEGYRFDMDFAASNVGWLAVQSESDGLSCWFLWMSSSIGDGDSALDDGTGWVMGYGFDLALCVN